MIEPEIIERMNLVIDGVATPAQRAKLDEYLATHPDARSYYDALSQLVRRLHADPIPEPPAELEPRILDAIHQTPAFAPARDSEPSTPWLKGFLAPRLRPWSTFGLGLATGVFLLAAIQWGRPGFWDAARDINPSHVSGSMVSERAPLGSIPVETEAGSVSGSAAIYAAGREVAVEVRLQSTVAVEWTVAFDPDAWTLLRVERHGVATSAFAANRGIVRGLHTGEGAVTVTFAGSPEAAQAVVIKILEGGQPVFEGAPSIHH
jgi:hypothetical protein